MPERSARLQRCRTCCFILLVTCLPGIAVGATQSDRQAVERATLPYPVQRLLMRYKVSTDSLGIFVQDVDAPEPLLAVEADTPRNPASSIKLLTTYVALRSLGPGYTWRTSAFARAPVRDGRLEGDLYLKGGGDPFLVTERFWKFLLGIRNSGITHIAGDLVIDDSYFSVPAADPGGFDGKPSRPYNAAPDAMLINFGVTRFWFVPDKHAHRVNILPDPPSTSLAIDNRLDLTGERCPNGPRRLRMTVLDRAAGGKVRFAGRYPVRCGRYAMTRSVATPIPAAFGIFKALWHDMGGSIDGGLRLGKVPERARRIHSQQSPGLAELIRPINKYSNNVMSRHFFLTLGAEHEGAPGTLEKGRAAVAAWLADNGLDFPELVLDNGAGLSRETRISPRSLGTLLLGAYRSPFMPEFIASLPLAAIDGTLARRFKGEAMQGRAHLKTGTLDNVKAMGGYLLSRSGRTFVVVAIQNYPGIQYGLGTQVQDELLRWVYQR